MICPPLLAPGRGSIAEPIDGSGQPTQPLLARPRRSLMQSNDDRIDRDRELLAVARIEKYPKAVPKAFKALKNKQSTSSQEKPCIVVGPGARAAIKQQHSLRIFAYCSRRTVAQLNFLIQLHSVFRIRGGEQHTVSGHPTMATSATATWLQPCLRPFCCFWRPKAARFIRARLTRTTCGSRPRQKAGEPLTAGKARGVPPSRPDPIIGRCAVSS